MAHQVRIVHKFDTLQNHSSVNIRDISILKIKNRSSMIASTNIDSTRAVWRCPSPLGSWSAAQGPCSRSKTKKRITWGMSTPPLKTQYCYLPYHLSWPRNHPTGTVKMTRIRNDEILGLLGFMRIGQRTAGRNSYVRLFEPFRCHFDQSSCSAYINKPWRISVWRSGFIWSLGWALLLTSTRPWWG